MNRFFLRPFENSIDALIPEVWAQESLMLLWQNMVMPNLVHTDFSSEVAAYGDIVNTRKPGKLTAVRKTNYDDVSPQDVSSTNVAVPLDQHLYASFTIKDGEEAKAFKNLREMYLVPAVRSLAVAVDQIITAQLYDFLPNMVGKVGTAVDKATIIAAREFMNKKYVPLEGRNVIITPNTEGALLNIGDFTTAEKIGDDGSVMRSGSMGQRFGMNFFMAQNTPSITKPAAGALVAGALTADEPAGETSLAVDGFSAAITNGTWLLVEGDMTPQQVTATTGGATPSAITISPGLKTACLNDAVVTLIKPHTVNLAAGYAAGWNKDMVIDLAGSSITVPSVVGQMLSQGSGASTKKYGLISGLSSPSTTKMTLNRSLETALADDAAVFPGPWGDYNFAFHRNCMAFVSRPLPAPAAGTGALSAVASDTGIGLRVTITYEGRGQGHLVTVDLLCGIKTLDTDLGVVILGG